MVLIKDRVAATVSSFLKKREESLAWETNLIQLADFAHTLLMKQHALYPHLRPMYRTVHRRIPRRLVFRAIRWVNPARMYPMAMLTREQIASMSKKERAEAIAQIADYRREAHLIRNRYNEMISLIHEGKLPYYIKFAGVKVQSMDQYLERAERLKVGAVDWEQELDVKAVEFREEMGKQGEKFDDVPELWVDGVPPFFDPKRGKEKKAPMRLLDKEGNRAPIDVFVRDFIDVHPDEIREGEDLWIPKKILIAGEAEAAGAIPIAIPTALVDHHFSNARNFLENEGQFQTELPGARKVRIRNMRIKSGYEAGVRRRGRREGRASHMDPLRDPGKWARERAAKGQQQEAEKVAGRWGKQPHAGGVPGEEGSEEAAAALGGDPEAHEEVLFPAQATPEPVSGKQIKMPVDVSTAESQIRSNVGMPEDKNIPWLDGDRANPVQVNADMQNNVDAIVENPWLYDEFDLSNIDLKTDVKFIELLGGGYNASKGHVMVVEIKGKKFIYKITAGEQLGEKAVLALDRTLGFGVQPNIHIANLGMTQLGSLQAYQRHEISKNGRMGGGFLMEYHPDFTSLYKDTPRFNKALKDKENRERFFGMMALDMMMGNADRHYGNMGVNSNNEVVAIDTGIGGRFAEIDAPNMRTRGILKWETFRDKDHYASAGYDRKLNIPRGLEIPGNVDIETEFNAWFDEHFDMAKALEVAEAANLQVVGKFMNGEDVTTESFKTRMREYVSWRLNSSKFSEPSWHADYMTKNLKIDLKSDPPKADGAAAPEPGTPVPGTPAAPEPQQAFMGGITAFLANSGVPQGMIDAALSHSTLWI